MSRRETVQTISAGQMKELIATLAESVPTDLSSIIAQAWIGDKSAFASLLRDGPVMNPPTSAPTMPKVQPVAVAQPLIDTSSFRYDKAKEGWTCLEDVQEPAPATLSVAKLQLVSFLEGNEYSVNGETMASRAVKLKASLGQRYAEWLLANQAQIPAEWRKFYLVFPGTVWLSPGGRRRVPFLLCDGGEWCLSFFWLELAWLDDVRLVQPGE